VPVVGEKILSRHQVNDTMPKEEYRNEGGHEMGIFDFLAKRPYPSTLKPEIDRMIENLVRIGHKEDFLSERSGGSFNAQCRHNGAREIGTRLAEIGGFELMEYILKRIRKRLGPALAAHLSYAWTDIKGWVP
jgi:hypothetical protein